MEPPLKRGGTTFVAVLPPGRWNFTGEQPGDGSVYMWSLDDPSRMVRVFLP